VPRADASEDPISFGVNALLAASEDALERPRRRWLLATEWPARQLVTPCDE
jgi:hypothetical protein